MRFHCGPTISQRIETFLRERETRSYEWHKTFLFLPKRIDETCAWLEFAETRIEWHGVMEWSYKKRVYRLINE